MSHAPREDGPAPMDLASPRLRAPGDPPPPAAIWRFGFALRLPGCPAPAPAGEKRPGGR